MPAGLQVREMREGDRPALIRILAATEAFNAEELGVALELIDYGLAEDKRGYLFAVAADDDRVLGYACWGDTPLAEAVYDLYWIAVDPDAHNQGIGRALLEHAERDVVARKGRMLLIETASKPSYDATRAFYLRTGYAEIARLPDYYRDGDDKVIYQKRFEKKT